MPEQNQSLIAAAFQETGVQLDRIITALQRENPAAITRAYYQYNEDAIEYNIIGVLEKNMIPDYIKDKGDLESIEIGNAVTSIGEGAFQYCSKLRTITIPNGVTSIGQSAFSGCIELESITIPSSVTSIGNWAFCDCSYLTSITIPNIVTNIGVGAFLGCQSLESITIPSSVASIGGGAFDSCNELTNVTFSEKTKTQVQGMSNYPWNLPVGCEIHCTNGTITIEEEEEE